MAKSLNKQHYTTKIGRPLEEVEQRVIQNITNLIYQRQNVDYYIKNFSQIAHNHSSKISKDIRTKKQRISTYNAKLDNYLEALSEAKDKDTRAAIYEKITKIHEIINNLSNDIKKLNADIPKQPTMDEIMKSKSKFRDYMKNPNNIIQAKELIDNIVECVYIHDKKITVKFKKSQCSK